jgi:hypothetical protein
MVRRFAMRGEREAMKKRQFRRFLGGPLIGLKLRGFLKFL